MENQALSGDVSAFPKSGLNSQEHLETILHSVFVIRTLSTNLDEKNHTLNVLKNSAFTTRKSLIFFSTLFEQIPLGVSRVTLKSPRLCKAKNSNKLCTLSFWSCGFPTLYKLCGKNGIYAIECYFCRVLSFSINTCCAEALLMSTTP